LGLPGRPLRARVVSRYLHDDVDEFLGTPKVSGVPCVERQLGGARRRRDEQV